MEYPRSVLSTCAGNDEQNRGAENRHVANNLTAAVVAPVFVRSVWCTERTKLIVQSASVCPTDAASERRSGIALGRPAHRQRTPIRKTVSQTHRTKFED